MENVHTNIIKKLIISLILIFTISSLSGCQKDIPDGDIKDFVVALNFDKAFSETIKASSVITSEKYVDGVLDGKIVTFTYIDQTDKYFYSDTRPEGIYFGNGVDQFSYYKQEILGFIGSDNYPYSYEKTDGAVKSLSYREEEVDILVKSFFYTQVEYNFHEGGTYYGDYIQVNCAKYYDFFRLNEDKTELTFELNSESKDNNGNKIITLHKFTVNKLGMLISLSTTSLYKDNQDTYTRTTIDCDYSPVFDKIYVF